jgi:apolipoprotein N-acyltransferase
MVKVNAAAVGLETAYASITGKSTFIMPNGSVAPTTQQLEETVLYGSIQYNADVPTIWVRFGDWFAFLAMAAAALAIAAPGTRGGEAIKTSERGTTSGFAPSGPA